MDDATAKRLIDLFKKYTAPPVDRESELFRELNARCLARYSRVLADAGFRNMEEVKEVEPEELVLLGFSESDAVMLLNSIPIPPRRQAMQIQPVQHRPAVRWQNPGTPLQVSTPQQQLHRNYEKHTAQHGQPSPQQQEEQQEQMRQQQRQRQQQQVQATQAQNQHMLQQMLQNHQPQQPVHFSPSPSPAPQPQCLNPQDPRYRERKRQEARLLSDEGWELTSGSDTKGNEFVDWMLPCTSWDEMQLGAVRPNIPIEWAVPTSAQSITMSNVPHSVDMLLSASTGSGKTAAYLLPILRSLLREGVENVSSTYGVVVGLTLELAQQIYSDALKLCRGTGINVIKITKECTEGDYETAIRGAHGRTHIVIGTVGRLSSVVRRSQPLLDISRARYYVVDEADKIAEMADNKPDFHVDLDWIKERLPAVHHTTVCSATLFNSVHKLCGLLKGYKGRSLLREDSWMISEASCLQLKTRVYQVVHEVRDHTLLKRIDKAKAIATQYLQNEENCKIILFAKKADLPVVAAEMRQVPGVSIYETSGDLSAESRTHGMECFRSARRACLVASYGTGGRGIDVTCPVVILLQMPENWVDYQHAIGRTARAGNFGTSIAFYGESDQKKMKRADFEKMLRNSPEGGEWRSISGETHRIPGTGMMS